MADSATHRPSTYAQTDLAPLAPAKCESGVRPRIHLAGAQPGSDPDLSLAGGGEGQTPDSGVSGRLLDSTAIQRMTALARITRTQAIITTVTIEFRYPWKCFAASGPMAIG